MARRQRPIRSARVRVGAVLLAAVLALLSPGLGAGVARPAVAQVSPPAIGAAIVQDGLTTPGFFLPLFCPSGRSEAREGPDGLAVRVTGRCQERATVAAAQMESPRAIVPDGNVEIEARITAGQDRTYLMLQGRLDDYGDGYALLWYPSGGVMQLMRSSVDADDTDADDAGDDIAGGGGPVVLARQTDLPVPAPGARTRLSLRFQGNQIWALLDGQPVLTATDSMFDEGTVAIGVVRRPKGLRGAASPAAGEPFEDAYDDLDPQDREEVAVTWQNLRISPLANGATARVPTIRTGSQARPGYAPPAFVPAPGTPPSLADAILEQSLAGPSIFPTFECPTKRASVVTVGEGLMLKGNGLCQNQTSIAMIQADAPGLTLLDGEARIEFRVVNGQPNAIAGIAARFGSIANSYVLGVAPAHGLAFISRLAKGEDATLARRTDLRPLIASDTWTSIAVRLRGDEIWLMVNDRPVLKTQDGTLSSGGFALLASGAIPRDGSQETAVVFRNLRISAVADAPEERRPTYRKP